MPTHTPPISTRAIRWLLAVYWATLLLLTHLPGIPDPPPDVRAFNPDKILHFFLFATLTGLLYFARVTGRDRSLKSALIAAGLIAGAYAYLDEYTQDWTGRQWDVIDLVYDLTGVLAAFVTLLLAQVRQHVDHGRVLLCRLALALLSPLALLVLLTPNHDADGVLLPLLTRGGIQIGADKAAHFAGAAALLWLLTGSRLMGVRRVGLSALAAVAVVAAIGPTVEWAQWLSAGRGYERADWLAHELGLAAGLVAMAAVAGWRAIGRQGAATTDPAPEPVETDRDSAAYEQEELKRQGKRTSFVGHAATISALTFLSRLTGLVRDSVQARAFGLGGVADAFTIGFLVPNLFRRLFGEGALTAAFIPVYTDLLKKDRVLARRFASLCMALLLVVLGGLTLIGEAALWAALRHYHESADLSLAVRLTMIMLPYMPLVCFVALVGAILQVHGRFGPSASAPILLNIVMVAATLWAVRGVEGEDQLRNVVGLVGWGVLVAGLVQALWQLVAMLRYEQFTAQFAGTRHALGTMLRTMLPTFIALSVFQINTFLDSALAFFLSPKTDGPARLHLWQWAVDYPIDSGGVAALAWSQRLYQFPLGVFGIAIATAIFPALSHAMAETGKDGERHFRNILRHGLRLTVFIGLPASVGLVLIRLPLVRLLFEGKEFDLEDSRRVAAILTGYAPAIWAYSMTHVLTRGFYALRDSATPMRLSFAMVLLNLMLNLALVWPMGAAGLAWSTAVCAIVQSVLMLRLIRPQLGEPLVDADVWQSWGRTAGLSLLMAVALVLMNWLLPEEVRTTAGLAGVVFGMLAVGVAIFAGGAWALKMPEVRWLVSRKAE